PDAYGTAWSWQRSCCHRHTAQAAAPGLWSAARVPGDGPDGPVFHPLCGVGGWSSAGAASYRASPMMGADGRSWSAPASAPPRLPHAHGVVSVRGGVYTHRLGPPWGSAPSPGG